MILSILFACSIKSGAVMIKAEQVYTEKNVPENRESVYEWSMAEAYLQKAREEYASSSFEEAENLAKKSIEWMVLSEEAAALKAKKESE